MKQGAKEAKNNYNFAHAQKNAQYHHGVAQSQQPLPSQ